VDEAAALASLHRRVLANLRVEGDWNGTPHLLWQKSTDGKGYGQVRSQGKNLRVHRVFLGLMEGPLPPPSPQGLVPDHLCRVRHCSAVDHIEWVTQVENKRRGEGGAYLRARTHCPQGHRYDETNTRWYRFPNGQLARFCKACHNERSRIRYANRKAHE
jgi:hypothetical protein